MSSGKSLLFVSAFTAMLAASGKAVDHNNLDAGRPLSFDDADSVAFRERSLESGISLARPREGGTGVAGELEFIYGFALNSHLSIGVEPSIGHREVEDDDRFDFGDVGVSLFHNFNREYGNTPAMALRADAHLPTGRDSRGVDFRLRGIASKTVKQYDRLHLNLDLSVNNGREQGERRYLPALILGYSKPLGYPRRFVRTGLAEIAVRSGTQRGSGAVGSIGVGMRQQVSVRSVFDIGLRADVTGPRDERDSLRMVAGYSSSF